MKLGVVVSALERAGQLVRAPGESPDITGIAEDSRRVTPGTLFCAVSGSAQDGHRFLGDAVRRGAAAVVVTRVSEVAVPQVVVRDARVAVALASAQWFGRPADGLTVVGVTGT